MEGKLRGLRFASFMKLVVPATSNRIPWALPLLPPVGGWKISSLGGGRYELRCASYRIEANRAYALNTFNEDGIVRGLYLGGGRTEGKTVLDVGAGCGETAAFFLAHGAKAVTCVEPNEEAFTLLSENIRRNGWENHVMPIKRYFGVELLNLPHDYIKMDCEGGEVELLKVAELKEGVIALHPRMIGKSTALDIVKRFGLIRSSDDGYGDEELWISRGPQRT